MQPLLNTRLTLAYCSFQTVVSPHTSEGVPGQMQSSTSIALLYQFHVDLDGRRSMPPISTTPSRLTGQVIKCLGSSRFVFQTFTRRPICCRAVTAVAKALTAQTTRMRTYACPHQVDVSGFLAYTMTSYIKGKLLSKVNWLSLLLISAVASGSISCTGGRIWPFLIEGKLLCAAVQRHTSKSLIVSLSSFESRSDFTS
jgi:hypothetical protein